MHAAAVGLARRDRPQDRRARVGRSARRSCRRLKPEIAALSKTPLGTPNLGGPIVTAGGIVFIGAAMDHVLRAFDVETGRELWKGPLPAGARATPMTYQVRRAVGSSW